MDLEDKIAKIIKDEYANEYAFDGYVDTGHADGAAHAIMELLACEQEQTAQDASPVEIEDMMVGVRQQALALISKVDPVLLDQFHALIKHTPGAIGTATIAAVLADVICFLSNTEAVLDKNVIIASEAILKIARAGLKNRPARDARSQLISH